MAFEEVFEGTQLDILYPAKHIYHLEIALPSIQAALFSHSFRCIP